MKLDSRKLEVSVSQRLDPKNWSSKPAITTLAREPQAGTWVQLQERPTPYSHDEALLLCQHSDSEWVVWIPEYGETILHRTQFCKP